MLCEISTALSNSSPVDRSDLLTRLRFLFYRIRRKGFRAPGWYRVAGLAMYLDPADPVDGAFYVRNFAHELRYYIRTRLRAGDTVLDVGAQKGFVTLHLRAAVGPSGCVIAFEPDPRSRALLAGNVARNSLANVTVLPYAVSEADGHNRFLLSSQLGYSGLGAYDLLSKTLAGEVEVDVRSLDSLLTSGELPKSVSFIKTDCQGFEGHILRGAARVLAEAKPALWVEVDAELLRNAGSSVAEIDGLLRKQGYVTYLPNLRRTWLGPQFSFSLVDSLPEVRGDYDVLALPAGRKP